jgi:putative peptidoglycan lipid II flippase
LSEPAPAKNSPSMLRSSAIVSAMTMLSRVLGLCRDIVFARFFGAGGATDAFYIAFKVPNFLRRLFAEGAFAQAFVPVLSEYREKGSIEAVRHFIDRVAGCLGLSLILVVGLVVLASPAVAAIFGSGFLVNGEYEKFWQTSDLIRITFPYLFLISMAGFASSILNSYDRFAVPAVTPVLLNVCLIIAAAFVSPHIDKPVYALAWGVLVAGLVQLCFQLPFLARLGLLPRPKVDWRDSSVRKVLGLMAPAMFGVSISQINLTLDTILASFLVDRSITWLYFSDRLIELPLGVFGVGIATVVLPNLSRQFAQGGDKFSQTLDWAFRLILLIGVPAAIALIVIAKPVLYSLFHYGKMITLDIEMASMSLRAYALGLCAFMLIKVLASAYFSRQDMRTPVRIGVIAMVSNMFLNLVFVLPLLWIWNVGHVGLALATACSAFINAGLLYRGLRRDAVYKPEAAWARFAIQLLLSVAVMALVLATLVSMMPDFGGLNAFGRVWRLALLVGLGGFVYASCMLLCGLRLKHLRAPL